MDELDILMAAIVADPDDDAPRLVYADALTDLGDERGEFIALQCALARETLDRTAARTARARVAALLSTHGKRWAGVRSDKLLNATFARGFVNCLRTSVNTLIHHADELLAGAPLLDTVQVTDLVAGHYEDHSALRLAGLLEAPVMRRLRGLYLMELQYPPDPYGNDSMWGRQDLGGAAIEILVEHSQQMGGLSALGVTAIKGRVDLLAGCAALANLTSLSLDVVEPGDAVLAILESPHLARVSELCVSGSTFSDLSALFAHPRVRDLRSLALEYVHTDYVDSPAVPAPTRLRRLELGVRAEADIFAALNAIELSELRELVVHGAYLSGDAVTRIVDWAESHALYFLEVATCELGRGLDLADRFGGTLELR